MGKFAERAKGGNNFFNELDKDKKHTLFIAGAELVDGKFGKQIHLIVQPDNKSEEVAHLWISIGINERRKRAMKYIWLWIDHFNENHGFDSDKEEDIDIIQDFAEFLKGKYATFEFRKWSDSPLERERWYPTGIVEEEESKEEKEDENEIADIWNSFTEKQRLKILELLEKKGEKAIPTLTAAIQKAKPKLSQKQIKEVIKYAQKLLKEEAEL